MTKKYGATPKEWFHFDEFLELTDDLLPVVCHPDAITAPESSLKGLGKTPSKYNAQQKVVGIGKWTAQKSTYKDIERYKLNPDLGICLQTRRVRALDIDVPDAKLSDEIAELFETITMTECPRRFRPGTGKQLLAFIVEEDVRKKVIRLTNEKGGPIVEVLGTGNQFVAIGEHFNSKGPSGTRYEWAYGLPTEFPIISKELFDEAIAYIVQTWGVSVEIDKGGLRRNGTDNRDAILSDEILAALDYSSTSADGGSFFFECPWKSSHSSDSGPSETAYFPAGTKGYELGHFKCQHASCAGRGRADFIEALFPEGLYGGDFEELKAVPVPAGAAPKLDQSKLERNDRGDIKPILTNMTHIVRHPDAIGYDIRYDVFRDALVYKKKDGPWRQFTDNDFTVIELTMMHNGMMPMQTGKVKQAVEMIAMERAFDSAIEWLETLPTWDGIPRIDQFYALYMGAEDSPYTRAVGAYTWTALAGRILTPGCQADMAPVLCGPQGLRKTSAVKAIAPHRELFVGINLLKDNEDTITRKLRGKVIAELAEMSGASRKDIESLRDFITRDTEEWVPKYKEFATTYKRRNLFIGTANGDEILVDPAGHRRWLPVRVARTLDVEGIIGANRQLWAEARDRYKANGVEWSGAEEKAQAEHSGFLVGDAWEDMIAEALDETSELGDDTDGLSIAQRGRVTTDFILREILNMPSAQVDKRGRDRVGTVMRALGWRMSETKIEGRRRRAWIKNRETDDDIA